MVKNINSITTENGKPAIEWVDGTGVWVEPFENKQAMQDALDRHAEQCAAMPECVNAGIYADLMQNSITEIYAQFAA